MDFDSKRQNGENLPDWADCEYFCIHDYAGARVSPCGWRGRLQDARLDENTVKLLCPQCGSATLLRIPHGEG